MNKSPQQVRADPYLCQSHVLIEGSFAGTNRREGTHPSTLLYLPPTPQINPRLPRFVLHTQVPEAVREPCLKPTVPPPDQDARWIYSSGGPSQEGPASPAAQNQRPPTVTLSSLVLTKCHSDPAHGVRAVGRSAFSPERLIGEGGTGGGTGGWVPRGEGEEEDETGGGGGTDRTNADGTVASAADLFSAGLLAGGASPAYRQASSREKRRRGGRRNMRRCRSTGEARVRPRGQVSNRALRRGGAEGSDARYGLSTRPSWSPAVQAAKAKDRKIGSGFGFSNSGGSHLGGASPSVSPWCRQSASRGEWGVAAGDVLDGQDRGVVDWADDASGSNA